MSSCASDQNPAKRSSPTTLSAPPLKRRKVECPTPSSEVEDDGRSPEQIEVDELTLEATSFCGGILRRGTRVRKRTDRYVHPDMATLMFQDIPTEEQSAVFESDWSISEDDETSSDTSSISVSCNDSNSEYSPSTESEDEDNE